MNLEKIFKNLIVVQFLILVICFSTGIFFGLEDTAIEEEKREDLIKIIF